MATIDELAAKYGGIGSTKVVPSTGVDIDALAAKYGAGPDYETLPPNIQNVKEFKSISPNDPSGTQAFTAGVGRGIQDIPEAVGLGIGAIDEAVTQGGADRNRLFKQKIKERGMLPILGGGTQQFENKFGDSDAASLGRTTGQVLATAPLVPSGTIARVTGALPVTSATGMKIAAPFANRFASTIGQGAVGGGEFGALTSQTNDKSLVRNIGEGAIMGAIGAPVISGASALGGKVVKGVEGMWANVNAANIARKQNLDVASVKNIIGRLEDAGLTPQQAQIELNKLGPKATIADLDRSLTTELSGLATEGGKATAIAKGRMDLRADTANTDATKILTDKFGPKPDVVIERGIVSTKSGEGEAIQKEAQRLTANDYRIAKSSPVQLDTSNVISNIDQHLETAVGGKEGLLKEVKGYFFKKDANGNPILKTSMSELHEIRKELDSIIGKAGTPQDSAGRNAMSAVKEIRNNVDALLKSNPAMAAADEKFAKHMSLIKGLQIGHDAITKGMNKEEFSRIYDAAATTPGMQEKIKRGMLAGAHNLMESSTQGELTGASRIFDKKAVNRANFRKAFGSDADQVLDDVHRELAFRATERAVTAGAQTAERQAVQARYGQTRERPSAVGEGFKSFGLDVIAGTPAIIGISRGTQTAVGNKLLTLSENARARLIEGSADILSRSGQERNMAVDVARRVKAVQDGIGKSIKSKISRSVLRLPVSSSSVVGEKTYETGEGVKNYGQDVIERWIGK